MASRNRGDIDSIYAISRIHAGDTMDSCNSSICMDTGDNSGIIHIITRSPTMDTVDRINTTGSSNNCTTPVQVVLLRQWR